MIDAAAPAISHHQREPSSVYFADERVALLLFAMVIAVGLVSMLVFRDVHLRMTLFVVATGTTTAVFFWLARGTTCWSFFHPSWGLLVLLALYSVASGLYIEQNGRTFYNEPLIQDVYWRYYLACWMAQFGLCFGILLRNSRGRAPPANSKVEHEINAQLNGQLLILALIVCIACLPWLLPKINFFNVKSYREVALSVRVERLGNDAAGITEVLTLYIPVTLMLIACIGVVFRRSISGVWRVFAGCILVAYFITGFLGGERYTVLYCGLFIAMYWYHRVRPIRVGVVIASGCLAYLLMNLIPIVRYSANPIEMWQLLVDSLQRDGFSDFKLGNSNELLTAVNLARQIQGVLLGESELNWGMSILSDVLVWIPRVLYENRPLPSSEKFVEVFYPGVRAMGGGYGFFIVQEGHWAFGVIGPALFMAAFGYFVASVHGWVMRWQNFDLVIFWYAAVYADLVMASVRSGVVGSIKAAMLHSVPFVFIGVVLLVVHFVKRRFV